MTNELVQWRAAIGVFYGKTQPMMCGQIFKLNVPLFISFGLLWFCYFIKIFTNSILLNKCTLSLAILLITLILLAGDIAENPGPEHAEGEINSISILHLNIRSIRNKLKYIEDNFTDFNILCFTETHLTDDIQTISLLLPGFSTPYRKDKSAHSGGILIYVSDYLLSERTSNLEIFYDECIWIKIKTNREKYFLCTIYRPPSSNADLWEALKSLSFI